VSEHPRRPTFTKVDWDILAGAMAYHEAASYGEEEIDFPPEGFRSWGEYRKRADRTREKVWDMLDRTRGARS
jgi:hypothetical protein